MKNKLKICITLMLAVVMMSSIVVMAATGDKSTTIAAGEKRTLHTGLRGSKSSISFTALSTSPALGDACSLYVYTVNNNSGKGDGSGVSIKRTSVTYSVPYASTVPQSTVFALKGRTNLPSPYSLKLSYRYSY